VRTLPAAAQDEYSDYVECSRAIGPAKRKFAQFEGGESKKAEYLSPGDSANVHGSIVNGQVLCD